jgi:hypothetical protein
MVDSVPELPLTNSICDLRCGTMPISRLVSKMVSLSHWGRTLWG